MPNGCTAGDIATPNPEACPADDVPTAADWLSERDYDSAPLFEDGRPIGYVTRDAAEAASPDTSLAEITEPLTVDVLIASDSPLDTVLEALYDRPFYYLADRNQVTGILTRADLNTEPVYQHLYTNLSQLEHAFRTIIQDHVPVVDEGGDKRCDNEGDDTATDRVGGPGADSVDGVHLL